MPPRYQAYQIQNQNPLLSTYPGMLAGKNGLTDAARYTYVGAAEQDGPQRITMAAMATTGRAMSSVPKRLMVPMAAEAVAVSPDR